MDKMTGYRPKPTNPIKLLKKRQREFRRFDNLKDEVKMIDDCIWHLRKMGWDESLKVEVNDNGKKAQVR